MALLNLADLVPVINFLVGGVVAPFLYIKAFIIVITMIFSKSCKVKSIYLWLAAFLILPMVFVIVFYIFLGRDYRHHKLFRTKGVRDGNAVELLRQQKSLLFTSESCENILLTGAPGICQCLFHTCLAIGMVRMKGHIHGRESSFPEMMQVRDLESHFLAAVIGTLHSNPSIRVSV